MSPWIIYWIGTIDRVICTAQVIMGLVIAVMIIAGALVILDSNDMEDFRDSLKAGRAYLLGLLLFLGCFTCVGTFCPSGKTLAAMYVVPAIVNNEDLRQDSREVYHLAVDFLKGQLKQEHPEEPTAP